MIMSLVRHSMETDDNFVHCGTSSQDTIDLRGTDLEEGEGQEKGTSKEEE